MTKKKSKPKTVYTAQQVQVMSDMKAEFPGLSIRKMADMTGVPKSVVGRWVKDPIVWKRKYVFNVPKQVKLSKKSPGKYRDGTPKKSQKERHDAFFAKVKKAKLQDKNKYKGLLISYDDDEFEIYSG